MLLEQDAFFWILQLLSLLWQEEFIEAALARLDQLDSEHGFIHFRFTLFLSLEVEFKLDKFLTELSIHDDKLLLILSFPEDILHNCIKKLFFDLIVTFELVRILIVFDLFIEALILRLKIFEHVNSKLVEFLFEVIWGDDVDGEFNLLDRVFLLLQLFLSGESILDKLFLLLIGLLSKLVIIWIIISASTPISIKASSNLISFEIALISLFVWNAFLDLTINQFLIDHGFGICFRNLAKLDVSKLFEKVK